MIGFAELAVIPVIKNRICETGMSVRMFSAYSVLALSTSVIGGYSFVEGVRDFYSRNEIIELGCRPRKVAPLPGIREHMVPFRRVVADGVRDIVIDVRQNNRKNDVGLWVDTVLKDMGVKDANVQIIATNESRLSGSTHDCMYYISVDDMR